MSNNLSNYTHSGKIDTSNPKKLKESISFIAQLESNHYVITRMIQKLNGQINSLAIPKRINQPTKKEVHNTFETTGGLAAVGMAIGAGLGGFAGCSGSSGIFDSIGAMFSGLFGGGIAGLIIGIIIGLVVDSSKKDERENEANAKYSAEMDEYNRQLRNEGNRMSRETEIKNALIKERNELIDKKNSLKSLLNDMYTAVGIDKDFRNFLSIMYMDRYLRLEVATKLGGNDGLYLLVEKKIELKYRTMLLEEIIKRLDNIIQQNDAIYDECLRLNDKCDNILKMQAQNYNAALQNGQSLESIRENSSIAAYNAEVMRQQYEIRNTMFLH